MGFLDGLFGRNNPEPNQAAAPADTTSDDIAVRRYDDLVSLATPEELERVHVEAFEELTPAQRELLYEQLLERAASDDERPDDAEPSSLGATAALVEGREPGALPRAFEKAAADPAWGESNIAPWTAFAGYLLGTELAVGILLSADATGDWDQDAADGPDPHFDGFGGHADGF